MIGPDRAGPSRAVSALFISGLVIAFLGWRERAEFLEAQIEDVKHSRRELAKVIAAVDQEIAAMFAGAFADVARHFEDGPIGLALVKRNTPVDEVLDVAGVSASQVVVVAP